MKNKGGKQGKEEGRKGKKVDMRREGRWLEGKEVESGRKKDKDYRRGK